MKVLDASSIILFSLELSKPELFSEIKNINGRLLIPEGVIEELKDNVTRSTLERLLTEGTLEKYNEIISNEEMQSIKNRFPHLGKGELEILVIHNHYTRKGQKIKCVIDDAKAYKAASVLGANLSRSISLIRLLKENNKITKQDLLKIAKIILDSSFRIDKKTIKEVLLNGNKN